MISTSELRAWAIELSTNGKVWVVFVDTALMEEMTVDEYISRKVDGKLERTLVYGSEIKAAVKVIRIQARMSRAS